MTGGRPIAVLLQSISGVSTINPLVAFYDIHGGKREVLFLLLSRTPHETPTPRRDHYYKIVLFYWYKIFLNLFVLMGHIYSRE
jgi:hypothetical protein